MQDFHDDAAALADVLVATAWPARRETERTLYRCRVWCRSRDSGPFHTWAHHRLLSAGGQAVIAALILDREEVRDIFAAALRQGIPVEVNQEPLTFTDVSTALGTFIPVFDAAPAPRPAGEPPRMERRRGE